MSNAATRQCAISEESCPPPFLIELAAARPDELLYTHIAQCKNCGVRFAAMQASKESPHWAKAKAILARLSRGNGSWRS